MRQPRAALRKASATCVEPESGTAIMISFALQFVHILRGVPSFFGVCMMQNVIFYSATHR